MDKRIEQYKYTYTEMYGHKPPEKEQEEEGVPESFWRTMDEGGSEIDG